jgi:hypothetical protein
MNLNKSQLDQLSNLCGLVIGIATVFATNDVIPPKVGATITGIAGALACWLSNQPATAKPTTDDLEEENVNK